MDNARRLMARLNPTTIRFDMGRGGVARLTAQDIAAALAFVKDELAREVFVRCWWPDGARLTAMQLDHMIARCMYVEVDRRQKRYQIACLEAHLARDLLASTRRKSLELRLEATRAQQRQEAAKNDLFPASDPEKYPLIRKAALDEIARPAHCQNCQGRGIAADPVTRAPVRCATCGGDGSGATSDSARARALNLERRNYARRWKPLYEWTWRMLADAEAKAARQFKAALR